MQAKMHDRGEMAETAIQSRTEKKLRAYVSALQTEVNDYDEIFRDLVVVSECKDVDEMVKKFIQVEDVNFADFNYAKDQSTRARQYESEIEDFVNGIEEMQQQGANLCKERKNIMNGMEEKIGLAEQMEATTSNLNKYEFMNSTVELSFFS